MANKDIELPDKIKDLLGKLSSIEEEADEFIKRFENEESGDIDLDYEIWRHMRHWPFGPYGPIWSDLHDLQGGINVIPRAYGTHSDCKDTLLVIVEPSLLTLLPRECILEKKLKKRFDDTIRHLQNCSNTQYIVFWASPWEFRVWAEYKNKLRGKTVLLKPWKMNAMKLL